MDPGTLIREYLLLGLRFDRIEEGYVDSFTGDPALREAVASEPAPDPADLARQADRLSPNCRACRAPTGPRVSTTRAPTTSAPICARWPVPEGNSPGSPSASSTRSTPISTCRSARAIPTGTGRRTPASTKRSAARVRWPSGCRPTAAPRRSRRSGSRSASTRSPARCATGCAPSSRCPTARPINYEVVTDKPWSGFNYYLGDYRSTVAVNADLRQQMSNLPRLVAHESYPGHHTEHCRKEAGLVARHGHAEQTLFLVNTPQCLMAEGLADLALYVAIGPKWGALGRRDLRRPGASIRRGTRGGGVGGGRGAGRRPAGRRADAARRAPRRRRRGGVPAALAAGQRRAGQADAAVPVLAAVAGLHQHLRRGIPAAAGLAGRPARRASASPSGSAGCSTSR